MSDIANILESPLLKETHARQRARLLERFPMLEQCPHNHFLSLRKFITEKPERFFDEAAFQSFFKWMVVRDNNSRDALQDYFKEHSHEINRAFFHLEEINKYEWHDFIECDNEYELIRFIDQEIHPAYLRLVEGVFVALLHPIAFFSRLDRDKGTDGLNTWAIVDEVQRTRLKQAIIPYKHVIRNGIAHGGITYVQREIRYRDLKGNEEKFEEKQVVRLFDDLLDLCNSVALAIGIFLLSYQKQGYGLAKNLLLNELEAETHAPWWEVTGCLPTELTDLNQLNIYAIPKTYDYGKVQISAFQTALLAEHFAPGYDRYFFSIKSQYCLPGWAAFDGKKMHQLRKEGKTEIVDYTDILEDNLLFFIPRKKIPKLFKKMETLLASLRITISIVEDNFRKHMGWNEIVVRETSLHGNAWGSVLGGSVIFYSDKDPVSQEAIKASCRRIIKKCLHDARKSMSRSSIVRYLPLGFGRIAVFQKDFRRRRLLNYGLAANLIGTIQVKRIRRIQTPDLYNSDVEIHGKYRIAWNRAWLDSLGNDSGEELKKAEKKGA